jgi:hypothetical protein
MPLWDCPSQSSQPFYWTWEAFQGKAFPNPYNGDLERDQRLLDAERERVQRRRASLEEREHERVQRNLAKRRREKTGRGW